MLVYFLITLSLGLDTRIAPPTRPPAPLRVITACASVRRSEVEEALGQGVSEGQEETLGPASTCDFAAGRGLVSLTIQHLAAKPDRALEIASLRKELPESVVRDAPVFGADAFFLDLPGIGTQLHVIRAGREHLMVSVLGFDQSQAAGAAERIARKALARF